MANEVLKVHNLSIGYQSINVAEHISFSIDSGKLCAIVGVNGIGKSTLLRTLGKLQPALSGEIMLKGKDIKKYTFETLSKEISLVLTEPIASKNLTVSELIALGRQPYTNWIGTLAKEDKKHIKESLKALDLETLEFKKCHELSDGQMQRVLIARAMAQDTPLILLDEPTTHLDLYHKVHILKLLKKLAHQNGKTILFTTHEIDLAIQLCDKILILDGKENPFGEPCELIEENRFEKLFPSDMVQFDSQTGSFRIRK